MGTLTQLTDKVRLTAGVAADLGSGVRMYSRATLTKPFRVRLGFTRKVVPVTTTANGAFNLLGWVEAVSSAPTPIPANWPGNTATADNIVASFLRGFRFALGNVNSGGTGSNTFRAQSYNGDGTRTQYISDVVVNLGLNVEHEIEFLVTGSSASLTAVDLGITVNHAIPLIGTMSTGFLMLYTSPGMEAEWGNFRRIS